VRRAGEEAHLRADPHALACGERLAERREGARYPGAEAARRSLAHLDAQLHGAAAEGAGERIRLPPSGVGVEAVALPEHEAAAPRRHREHGVVAAHHDQPGLLPLTQRARLEQGRDRESGGGQLLKQELARRPEGVVGRTEGNRTEAQGAPAERPPGRVGVRLPLPLQPERVTIELVARLRHQARLARHGDASLQHGLAGPVAVGVVAHHRPSALPAHRLEVHDTAVGSPVLEVQEPVGAVGGADPAALVRAVHGGAALGEDDPVLVRTVDGARAQRDLPPRPHPARGGEYPVPAVSLVELGPLDRGVLRPAVEDRAAAGNAPPAVGAELEHGEHAIEAGPASRPRVDDVHAPVVVPERAGVDEPEGGGDEVRRRPRPGGTLRRRHVEARVGVAPVDPEAAVVVADGRRPHALAVLRPVESRRQPRKRVAHDRPVDEVARAEDGQAGHAGEARRDEVVLATNPDDVGIRVVGEENGVRVGPVAPVGNPGSILGEGRRGCDGQHAQHESENRALSFPRRRLAARLVSPNARRETLDHAFR
jgi:hypothetical protein